MKFTGTILVAVLFVFSACEMMPRNNLNDCRQQCEGSKKSKACYDFCDCIHREGQSLDSCLDKYEQAGVDSIPAK